MEKTKGISDCADNPCIKLETASRTYKKGYTCSQAVFAAFAEDMGLDEETAYRLMEGFGGGFGGKQEVCGAFSAAVAVISYFCSSGSLDGKSKGNTYKVIRKASEVFEQEYGSIICREILHGSSPKAFQCGMKVKDAVLLVGKVLAENTESQQTDALGGMSPKDALEYMKTTEDLVIVEVNAPEWKLSTGFTRAMYIPYTEMGERCDEIPEGRPVLLHCGGGIVSVEAYETLLEKRLDIPQLGYIAGVPPVHDYNKWLAEQG